jgi:hypothetical protein
MGIRQKRLEQHAIVRALRFLPRESLPTPDSDIDKEWVNLNAEADPPAGQAQSGEKEVVLSVLPDLGLTVIGRLSPTDAML